MSKFFTYEERLHLQSYLKEGLSFKEISRRLGKDPSTISREVRKYSTEIATVGRHIILVDTAEPAPGEKSVVKNALEVLFTVNIVLYVIKVVLTI